MAKSETQSLRGHDLINVPSHISITPDVISRLDTFFEFMPPNDLRENLMGMYHSYIQHEHDCLPRDFSRVAEGMIMFFNFLKFAGEEFNGLNGVDSDRGGRGTKELSTKDF